MAKTVLIVDDDPTQRRLLQAVVEKSGFSTLQAGDGDAALAMALGTEQDKIHVMLLDLVMPGRDGMDTLDELAKKRPDLPVIVLTGKGSIDAVVKAMKAGARDFVVKPAAPERIIVSIRNALDMKTLVKEVKRLKKTTDGGLSFEDLIGNASSMRSVVAMGERGAKANIPILITGESGVGKEVIARAIQTASERSDKPFIPSIAARFLKASSSLSYSVMKKAPSQVQMPNISVNSKKPIRARFSSTKSANCRWKCRSNSYGCCKKAKSILSAPNARSLSMFELSARPTAILPKR